MWGWSLITILAQNYMTIKRILCKERVCRELRHKIEDRISCGAGPPSERRLYYKSPKKELCLQYKTMP